MRADVARIWTAFRLVIVIAIVAGVLSFLAGSFLSDGLGAIRGTQNMRDFGVVAHVTDVRIHVSRSGDSTANSGSDSSNANAPSSVNRGYWVDEVQVVFTDPQGQRRSESLGAYLVHGTTPTSVGWTTQFEDHDTFVGKEVLYLPNQPRQALMRDQMQSTLDHGLEPAPTYIGIGLSAMALLGWAVLARVAIGKLRPWMAERRRRLPGIA